MTEVISPAETRTAVDSYIDHMLETRKTGAADLGQSYEEFWQTIHHVVMAGGKRIRPHLTVIAYGKLDEKIVPIAAAQELIHVAMLMHDDVIDQDFVRHGAKNVNGLYRDSYAAFVPEPHTTHYANSAAILSGDALISEAYRAILASTFEPDVALRLSDLLHKAIYEVLGGELMDVEAAFVTDKQFEPLVIYRYKTSSYSFICPLVSGAVCAGADEQTIATLTDFATNIGIAFQMQDDLLGVFGDEAETGKTTTGDLREGKRTLLVAIHEARMDDAMRQNFEQFGNADADVAALEQIKADMRTSGAEAETIKQVALYFDRADDALQRLPEGVTRTELTALHQKLSGRRA